MKSSPFAQLEASVGSGDAVVIGAGDVFTRVWATLQTLGSVMFYWTWSRKQR